MAELTVTIDRIGAAGDGIAMLDGTPLFVPQAAPGDRMRVRVEDKRGGGLAARPLELLEAGPQRAEPPCPHFGPCGGCLLQHLAAMPYRDWKRRLVVEALARRGLAAVPVDMPRATPPKSRRRATFSARRLKRGVALGFSEHRGNRIVDLQTCMIVRPEIAALLPPLREELAALLPEGAPAEVAVTRLDDGIDMVLGLPRAPGLDGLQRLAAFAEVQDLARLSWRPLAPRPQGRGASLEPVAHRRPGTLALDGLAVVVPPGSFLQASAEGEAILQALAAGFLCGAGRVADLFCGVGTFALPMARTAQVLALDSNAAAIAALAAATNAAGPVGPGSRLETRVRDLDKAPLAGRELAGLDAVVFDPPRRGARAQAEALAAGPVPVVVALSCNPASFGRDARILVDGGYRLEQVVPVDQFLWSPHVELAALFRR